MTDEPNYKKDEPDNHDYKLKTLDWILIGVVGLGVVLMGKCSFDYIHNQFNKEPSKIEQTIKSTYKPINFLGMEFK